MVKTNYCVNLEGERSDGWNDIMLLGEALKLMVHILDVKSEVNGDNQDRSESTGIWEREKPMMAYL